MRNRRTVPPVVLVGLVAAILLVFGGFYLGASPGGRDALRGILPARYIQANADTQLQSEVLQKLESSYYKAVDPAALKEQAIKGMVASLNDPYTVYFDPKEYKAFKDQESGSYSGVGMVMEMSARFATIVSVFKGSPAELAGIKPGDIIVAINGASTKGMILDDISATILGASGTTVRLRARRQPRPAASRTRRRRPLLIQPHCPRAGSRSSTPSCGPRSRCRPRRSRRWTPRARKWR
jgi:carboxyl-terminal processing protease